MLGAALGQARDARLTILEVLDEAIDTPDEMSPNAPRVISVKVPVDKIGEVIGPKGKMINQIQEETGADISIEDDGTVYIGAVDGPSAEAARAAINAIANPHVPEVGERFVGTVVKTTSFGAFISLSPGKDGLLHISQIRKLVGGKRVENVDDVLSIGQKVQVEIGEIDPRGKLSLVAVTDEDEAAPADAVEPAAEATASADADMAWHLPLVPTGEPGAELTAGQDGATIRRSVLPGGVRVLTEHMPGQRSATVGAWIGVGSRDETDGHFGSTHFLEHLLFKGTARRSAMDIAEAFDAVGGEANASTGKEHTCYYARVLDSDLPMAVDVISDMVTSARLDADELETERGVILEELAMNDDDPTDVVHEQFSAVVLGDHPLGRPIGGTPETINAVPRDAVWDHYRWNYRPETLVVTAAGGIDHDKLVQQVTQALTDGGWDLDAAVAPRDRRAATEDRRACREAGAELTVHGRSSRPTSSWAPPGIAATDDRRFALSVLNAVLGGGMSSRLFQEIREKRGLAYSTYSFASAHGGVGTFGLYAGCAAAKADQVTELLVEELERFANDGITESELARRAAVRRYGARAGGLRVAHEPPRQGRARVRRPAVAGGVARTHPGGHGDEVQALAQTWPPARGR